MDNQTTDRYRQFGQYTNTGSEIAEAASQIRAKIGEDAPLEQVIWEVCILIENRARDRSVAPSQPHRVAKTLIESRFTKASDMIELPISSCGALATLAASLLRQLGYAVKLIHDSTPTGADQHAWIEVYDYKRDKWIVCDPSAGNGNKFQLNPKFTRELECADWSEIAEQLEKEHERNRARRGL